MRSNFSTSCRSLRNGLNTVSLNATSLSTASLSTLSGQAEAVSRYLLIGGLCGATLAGALPLWAAPVARATVNDAKGPIVSILQPQYNDQIKGSVSVLIGVETRNNFTPQSVEMFVDGASQTDGPIALLQLPSANFTWDTTRHVDGPHKLTVVVTDTQGFRGSSEVTVYINNNLQRDRTPPALQWLNVQNGQTWRGVVNVQLKVVDNFGVKYLFVLLNPATDPLKKPASASWFLNRPPYTVPIDSRKVPDGLYVLRALAYDALENEGAAPTLQIGIANNSINPTPFPSLDRLKPPTTAPAPLPNAPRSTPTNPSDEVVASSSAPKDNSDNGPIRTEGNTTPAEAASGENGLSPRSNPNDLIVRAPGAPRLPTASSPLLDSVRQGSRNEARPSRGGSTVAGQTFEHQSSARQAATRPNLDPRNLPGASNQAAAKRTPIRSTASSAKSVAGEVVVSTPPSTLTGETRIAASGAATPGSTVARATALPNRITALPATPRMAGKSSTSSVASGEPQLAAVVADGANGSIAAHSRTRLPGARRSLGGARFEAPNGKARAQSTLTPPTFLSRVNPPRVGSRPLPVVPPMNPARSGLSAWVKPAQGSVSAPMLPTLPSPDLIPNRAPLSTRSSLPAIAALPNLTPRSRSERAAIVVTPADPALVTSALPAIHIAQRDETLRAVAKRYQLPLAVLATHNKMVQGAHLKTGQKVLLPQPLAITYRGKPVNGDVASMMVGSTGITPFRFLFEKQGGRLYWNSKTKRVTARNATHQVTLTIGSDQAVVNEKDVMMDLAAFLLSGRTMVPIRFFEKALQAKVEWEPATGRLFVAMAN